MISDISHPSPSVYKQNNKWYFTPQSTCLNKMMLSDISHHTVHLQSPLTLPSDMAVLHHSGPSRVMSGSGLSGCCCSPTRLRSVASTMHGVYGTQHTLVGIQQVAHRMCCMLVGRLHVRSCQIGQSLTLLRCVCCILCCGYLSSCCIYHSELS